MALLAKLRVAAVPSPELSDYHEMERDTSTVEHRIIVINVSEKVLYCLIARV